MNAQESSHPASTVQRAIGVLTSEPVSPVRTGPNDRVTAMLPLLSGCPQGGRVESDWMDFILSGSSATPTGGLAVTVGNTAVYLLFNLSDRHTHAMLKAARRSRRLDLMFRDGLLPIRDARLLELCCSRLPPPSQAASPMAWLQHALERAPALPAMCANAVPAFGDAQTHVAVALLPCDDMLAIREGKLTRPLGQL